MAGNHAGLGNFNLFPQNNNALNYQNNNQNNSNHLITNQNNPPNQEFCHNRALQWVHQYQLALALMSSNFNYNIANFLNPNDQSSAKVLLDQTLIESPFHPSLQQPFNSPPTMRNDPSFSQFNQLESSTIDLSLQKNNRAHNDAVDDQHRVCQQEARNAHLLTKQPTKGTSSSNTSKTPTNPIATNNNQDNGNSRNSPSNSYWRLLESLYAMNDKPGDDAIELIAQRISATKADVAEWFQSRREAERSILYNSLSSSNAPNATTDSLISLAASSYKPQPPAVPSSALLAKLAAVTSRLSPQAGCDQNGKLDHKMIDLLEAFYAINDNPEPAAIEMIAKRVNTSPETIGNWFDERRIKMNPQAEPRSPPAKKREGGRVVTFSEYQRSLLEAIFDETNYLHPQEYEELSNLIQVPSRNIKIWFKNRRSKQRLSGRIASP